MVTSCVGGREKERKIYKLNKRLASTCKTCQIKQKEKVFGIDEKKKEINRMNKQMLHAEQKEKFAHA
jgi:hypothetical protein